MLPALDNPDDCPEDDNRPCRESAEELEQAEKIFTSQMSFLYSTLSALEKRVRHCALGHDVNIKLTIYTPRRLVLDEAYYCRHRMYVSWPLHLLFPEKLPAVGLIHTLVFKKGHRYNPMSDDADQMEPSLRSLDSRVMLDLASKLTSLRQLKCRSGGESWQSHIRWDSACANQYRSGWDGPLRDSRRSFADAVAAIKIPNLGEANLDFVPPHGRRFYRLALSDAGPSYANHARQLQLCASTPFLSSPTLTSTRCVRHNSVLAFQQRRTHAPLAEPRNSQHIILCGCAIRRMVLSWS